MHVGRMIAPAVYRSLPIAANDDYYTAMVAARADYTAKVRGNKGRNLGPPDTFNFTALAVVAKASLSDQDGLLLGEYLANCRPGSKLAKQEVLICTAEKMHSSATRRLMLKLRNKAHEDLVVRCINKP